MGEGDQFFLAASDTGERIELTGNMSVGRGEDCDLLVNQGQPSRQHAKLSLEGGRVYVEDLSSTNGTFINGQRVTDKKPLNDGDEVAFDQSKFTLQVVGARAPAMDATILRVDPAATILRPIIEEPAAEAPAETQNMPPEPAPQAESVPAPAPAPTPAPTPAAAAPAAKPKPVKPGSWADPNAKAESSTQFFSPEDLAKIRGGELEGKVQSDVPYLQVATGNAAGSVIQLILEGDSKEWTIGSDASRDIVFGDPGVSEFHTIIVYESGRWKVVDQMSTNGTHINGSKTITAYLNSGDRIRVGTVECEFVLPGMPGMPGKSAAAEAGGGNKVWVGVAVFAVVLAVLFGAYLLL